VQYFRDNVAKVTGVTAFLADGELLHVALAAFDLGELVNDKASVRRLLTEITFLPNSLARTDPRYMRFAKAFETLRSDNGAQFQSAQSVDAVVAAFENKLLQTASGGAELANYYRDAVGKVTSVAELVADDQLLAVALRAFGLGELADEKAKVEQLLTEDPGAPGALATTDSRYAAFAAAFGALATDGGAKLRTPEDVEAVLGAYRTTEFDRLFKLANPATRTGLFGAEGEKTIADLLGEFQRSTGYTESVAHYRAQIGRVRSVDAFLADKRLVDIALTAFRMETLGDSPTVLRALLMQDPNAPGALAQSDPRYMRFAQEFASLKSGTPIRETKKIDAFLAEFTLNQFQKSLDSSVRQAAASSGKLTDTQLLADRTLAKVTREALYLPTQIGALELDQQKAAMKRAGLDPEKLQDPAQLEKFVMRYLSKASLEQASATPSLAAQLFQTNTDNSGALLALLPGMARLNLLA
jgi:hypothetical protein